jgi:hypothetical protein
MHASMQLNMYQTKDLEFESWLAQLNKNNGCSLLSEFFWVELVNVCNLICKHIPLLI